MRYTIDVNFVLNGNIKLLKYPTFTAYLDTKVLKGVQKRYH